MDNYFAEQARLQAEQAQARLEAEQAQMKMREAAAEAERRRHAEAVVEALRREQAAFRERGY